MGIEIQGEPAGRLTFLMRPDLCPKTVENFVRLCKGSDVGVDPKLTYQGCAFEPYSGKYTYTCKGRGKHVFGAGKFVERDAMSATRNETPGVGGGTYYGEPVDLLKDERSVVLTIPISGPGFGASRFAVVRVGETKSLEAGILAVASQAYLCSLDCQSQGHGIDYDYRGGVRDLSFFTEVTPVLAGHLEDVIHQTATVESQSHTY